MAQQPDREVKKPLWIFYAGLIVGAVAIFIGGLLRLPIGVAVLIGGAIALMGFIFYVFRAREQKRPTNK
ncbi:hypothetical protein [Curtobacterium sp. B8]|uniref:hypothetical protein n=1 Tax=Curtobacterium sp. B8 TaxID=95611 RepID=UPI0011D1CED8|nr:hypothetical protein [Curtobacterium sp. B8]